MRINHNIAAMNTYNKLTANNSATSKSLEKLSSGLKINRAGDNAAGLAISEKMRSQIRGLDQASSNANDGISLINVAEGALSETHSILQRMRELAVQSSNDTNTTDDRAEMQKEIDQLTAEIDRIGNTTEFNTKKLLNGGAGLSTTFTTETVSGNAIDWVNVTGGTSETASSGSIAIVSAAAATGATTGAITVATTVGAKTFTINGYSLSYTATGTATTDTVALYDLINANSDKLGVVATKNASNTTLTITTTNVGSAAELSITSDDGDIATAATIATQLATPANLGKDASISEATIAANYIARGNTITVTGGSYKGMELQFNGSVMSTTAASNLATATITGNGVLALQIGANSGQEMSVSMQDMRSSALGVNALNVTSQANAKAAMTTLDSAIRTVSSERAKLGGYQNRLEHTINNLGTTSENLSASESRIRDVDMAKEMMDFTKNNILSQAAQAMLAQANQQPQSVLQLLQ
ncbi:MAG: flagellin [Eubacteriales bacterium]|nr:flagellin [Eubacteriales bacterium]